MAAIAKETRRHYIYGMNEYLTLISDLSNAAGISGFEDEAVAVLRRYSADMVRAGVTTSSEDSMRNFYLNRSSSGANASGTLPRLMLDAHSDEVGFMIRTIKPNGTMEFITIGGWAPATVPAHRVRVRNSDGVYIPGIIAMKPTHFMTEAERSAAPVITNLVIDVGASSGRELREDYRIGIGAPVVPDTVFEYRENSGIMIGKAFDNRLGCAALLAVQQRLAGTELGVELCAAFASQEEVGLRGATVTVQTVKPDIAIVFEGAPADDTVAEEYARQTALKKGPMLRHIDERMITNPCFQRFALDIARKNNIPVQEGVRTGGATNGGAIHLGGKAIPVIVIGIPVRYIHTHYGIAAYQDFESAVQLGCEIIKALNKNVIQNLYQNRL
ncbi:peptidase M42 [Spirochaetia bacterium]|nr:peptidase M42 [Spirochaetia bacterium]